MGKNKTKQSAHSLVDYSNLTKMDADGRKWIANENKEEIIKRGHPQ
jgi:hypothetical protein